MKLHFVLLALLLLFTGPTYAAFPVGIASGLVTSTISDTPATNNLAERDRIFSAPKNPGPAKKGFAFMSVTLALAAVGGVVAAIATWPVSVVGALSYYLLTMLFGVLSMVLAYSDASSVRPHPFWNVTAFGLSVLALIPLELVAGAVFLIHDLWQGCHLRRKERKSKHQNTPQ